MKCMTASERAGQDHELANLEARHVKRKVARCARETALFCPAPLNLDALPRSVISLPAQNRGMHVTRAVLHKGHRHVRKGGKRHQTADVGTGHFALQGMQKALSWEQSVKQLQASQFRACICLQRNSGSTAPAVREVCSRPEADRECTGSDSAL